LLQLSILTGRVSLRDPDGTNQDVRVNSPHNIQQWEVNLRDDDGDGVWEGVVEWRPESTGRPLLKVIARDGVGDNANIDILSRNLVVEAAEADGRVLLLGLAAGGVLGGGLLVAWMVQRRRRAAEELDLLTSWNAFKAQPTAESSVADSMAESGKVVPSLEENIMDGTHEVQAELDELL